MDETGDLPARLAAATVLFDQLDQLDQLVRWTLVPGSARAAHVVPA